MATTFDILSDYINDVHETDPSVRWEEDTDIADRIDYYCELFGAQRRDVHLFVALRASNTLRDAFVAKYDQRPELECFEDFAYQLINVILPYVEVD